MKILSTIAQNVTMQHAPIKGMNTVHLAKQYK